MFRSYSRLRDGVFLALMMTAAASAVAAFAADSLPQQLPPEQEAVAIQSAEATGRAIYLHDRAASIASDALLEFQGPKRDNRVRGYITQEMEGRVIAVTFIDQTPAALYRILISDQGPGRVTAFESPSPLSTFESGADAARVAAMSARFEPCSTAYNSVVLPAAGAPARNWVVYLLPGTTKNDVVPIGGTFRMAVEGSKVVAQRAFTRTCIALGTDAEAVALMTTHLMDPVPTEAHVFWSLWANKPMYVATPPHGTIWAIAAGKITLIERKTDTGSKAAPAERND